MNRTVCARRWAILGIPAVLAAGCAGATAFCGGGSPGAPWALLLSIPAAMWWGMGAACLRVIRPCWAAGSSRRLALADRWLFGGLCAAVASGLGIALLIAVYAPVIDFPGVLPALAVICVALAQGLGYLAFCSGRLRLLRHWPGRFRAMNNEQ